MLRKSNIPNMKNNWKDLKAYLNNEIVGQEEAINEIIASLKSKESDLPVSIPLTGSTGVGKTKTVQESSQGGLRSGDVLVSKLATLKLYGDSGKNKFVTTLGKADALVFMGEEENGMIHVSSDKGEGWVQKPLVAVR